MTGRLANKAAVVTGAGQGIGEGIAVRLHETLPANDGGLCFGQVIEAAALQND